jgi:hypothetical protein
MKLKKQADHGSTRMDADQSRGCFKSAIFRVDLRSILCLSVFSIALMAGCKSAPQPAKPKAADTATAETYHFPTRPTVPPPAVKVFHQDEDTYTLVTRDNATDDEIAAIIWQFRDAAHAKTFDKLHLSQKFVDARKPTVWIHVYRGAKCANEKFTTGKYPCGAKYNGAGDYTLGSYTNPLWDDGVLHLADGTESKLWDPDAPYTASH